MLRVALSFVLCLTATVASAWGQGALDKVAVPGTKAVVLFFVASDCPVSNRTFPEMKRVRESFVSQGVAVRYVYPNVGETAAEIRVHQRGFDARGVTLGDADGALVRLTHAKVTPEAVVLVRDGARGWKTVYAGRVDDRFVHIGQERPAATEHFVEAAVRSVLAGRPVAADPGGLVGCSIVSRGAR